MQIHNLNEFVGALNSGAFLAVDNGQDTGKLAYTDLFAGNSFETIWSGSAKQVNDEIDLSKPLTDFDFLDIYYKGTNGGIKYTRIPTDNFPNSFVLETSGHVSVSGTPFFYNFLSTITKTTTSKLTISAVSEYVVEDSSSLTADIIATGGIEITRIDGISTPGNTKGVVAVRTITLAAADWSDYSQTVTVEDVTANNSVLVCAAPGSQTDFMTYGVNCVAQGADELTFACQSTPASDLTVYVMIVG